MGKGMCNGEDCIRKRKDSRWKRFFMASYDLVAGKQKAKNFQAGVKEKQKKAIGVEHIWFPDLRHTFATFSLKNGVDAKTPSTPWSITAQASLSAPTPSRHAGYDVPSGGYDVQRNRAGHIVKIQMP